jgi:hypothetical protein
MNEKRKYTRYSCKIKTDFDFYEGNPDEIDVNIAVPEKGSGFIIDISAGGVFIVSDSRVAAGLPICVFFKTGKNKYSRFGRIIRTGMLENNPSEIARRFAVHQAKGETYIAVEFDEPIESFSKDEL